MDSGQFLDQPRRHSSLMPDAPRLGKVPRGLPGAPMGAHPEARQFTETTPPFYFQLCQPGRCVILREPPDFSGSLLVLGHGLWSGT